MKGDIYLDEQHGVNPSITTCFWCGEDVGIALFGKLLPKQKAALRESGFDLGDDGKTAPRRVCLDRSPCDKCLKHMDMGVILISVDEKKSKEDTDNPYRTGGWCVVKEDFIKRLKLNPPELEQSILEKRVAFLPDETWDMLGLPRG